MARSQQQAPVVRFYQLAAMPLEVALVSLVGKAWQRGVRSSLLVRDEAQARWLDELLWSMPPPQQFLPHGLWNGPEVARQPILIGLHGEDSNQATLLVVVAGQRVEDPQRFDMVIDFVSGSDPESLRASRQRYRHYRDAGCQMEYWIQEAHSGWQRQEKAVKENPN
ncbi:MAG: DNA polymerase III subunit chi [Magnetococcales bacterium]|nr:DNA polymerase III subunit chi [Magnetococcales bacterium]